VELSPVLIRTIGENEWSGLVVSNQVYYLEKERVKKMRAKSGFTLVEILIVVVILGILAAIVIPQFTSASSEAKLSALRSDLQTVRSQIELYKIQHTDQLPGTVSGVTFVQAMTSKTDVYGNLDAAGKYGRYMEVMPKNPYNDDPAVEETAILTAANGNTGWFYNKTDGTFKANDLNTNVTPPVEHWIE
jgi:general secretion pathway protein G